MFIDPDSADNANKLAEHIPFLLAAGDGRVKINWMRLFELGLVLGSMVVILRTEVDGLKSEVRDIKASVEQMRHDLYIPKVNGGKR